MAKIALLFALFLALQSNASAQVYAVGNGNISQVCTTWTPTDQSGASLSLTVTSAYYCKTGLSGIAWFDITYPTTVSASGSSISLPFTCQSTNFSGTMGFNSLATAMALKANGSTAAFTALTSSVGAQTNATVSTGHFIGSIACTTTS